MKLRSLLHRKTSVSDESGSANGAEQVPLLPSDETRDASPVPRRPRRSRPNGQLEERLERLLTPNELDLVQHHRI
ncbi:hypothetical protein OHB26_13465 [Nocardia sp. NBC_01503]|uniref:hypothetical protein n=1 Tax=Nocardia sp. NBC_01503 TaxID=2975997 RepID=UPI002E7C3926|nr:hypothetical protein [Nocardia sp. NBC_01503]WTL35109.1 hypothetical protein OHB26_13465 [Nocardia sp. NBC_01503]